jgi:hypothetical protein
MPSATVRLFCESRSASRTVRDAATLERPFYWRGSSVTFQLALADNAQFLLSPAVGQIIVEVKALTARSTDDSLMRKTFVAGDCDETFAAADWAGGAKQLLEARFTVAEAAILPGTYRLIVRHVDGDDEENTYLSTELQVLEPQSGSEGIDPPPVAWSYLDGVPMVRTDINQGLSGGQKSQARENIGLALSFGGNGAADENKVLKFGDSGSATVTLLLLVQDEGSAAAISMAAEGGLQWIEASNSGLSCKLRFPDDLTDSLELSLPRADGILALQLNLGAAADHAGITGPLGDGARHLAVWNVTQAKYQGLRLSGAAGAETPVIYNLP